MTFGNRHLDDRHLAKRHLVDRYSSHKHFGDRYLGDGHFANRHFANIHLADRHLTDRHWTGQLTLPAESGFTNIWLTHIGPTDIWSTDFCLKTLGQETFNQQAFDPKPGGRKTFGWHSLWMALPTMCWHFGHEAFWSWGILVLRHLVVIPLLIRLLFTMSTTCHSAKCFLVKRRGA